MKRKIFLLSAVFLFTVSFISCNTDNKSEIMESETYERIHEESEELDNIPSSITSDADEQLTDIILGIVERRILDKEIIYEHVFRDIELHNEETSNSGSLEGDEMYIYEGANGETLVVDGEFSSFVRPEAFYYYNCMDSDNLSMFSNEMDFSFASRKDVFNDLKDFLTDLGISISNDYECISLDYQTLQANENPIDIDGNILEDEKKPNWSEEDNCYYFFLEQNFGLPLYKEGYGDVLSDGMSPTYLEFLVDKSGIIAMTINCAYTLISETTHNAISQVKAIEVVEKKLDSVITSVESEIISSAMKCIPIADASLNFQLVPVWVITVYENVNIDGQKMSSQYDVLVNAETGQEIASGY